MVASSNAGDTLFQAMSPFWHKCEVPTGSENVCCLGWTGHIADITKPTHLTQSGQCSLNHLVSASE